jgi:4-hydroxy-tetrahydrodipicolinate synthase/quinolinate synthase
MAPLYLKQATWEKLMFQGSMVALVTPMKADNSLDWDALHKLVDWHLQEGTRALVPMGTTGESPTLDYKEHMDVVAAVVDQVNGRVPVIAGTGSNSTSEAIELTQAAKELKADGCLLITTAPRKKACICTTKPLLRL